jgi:small subunit ribosomal protein S14
MIKNALLYQAKNLLDLVINQIQKDKTCRQLYKKQELKRRRLKSTVQDLSLPTKVRLQSAQRLNNLNRNGSSPRLRNRCMLTGRGRGVYRFCKLSRISLRELASQGLLMGVTKSSW